MGVSDGLRLGGSFGYANTAVSLADDAGDTGINSALGAIYANYQAGRYFVTGALSGGWQGYDRSRVVTVNNLQRTAQADSDGWLLGASLQAGMCLCKADGWSFVPSLGVDYQHQWVDGYSEQGGGAAGVSMNSQSSDAVRLRAQARVGKDFLTEDLVVTPHLNLGVIEQFTMGGTATGNFASAWSGFMFSGWLLLIRICVAGWFGTPGSSVAMAWIAMGTFRSAHCRACLTVIDAVVGEDA